MHKLLQSIRDCRACNEHLPLGPRPIIQGHADARILIISQAPGLKVHETGVPWNDKSGERLRAWLRISKEDFYNPKLIALLPMGFCYPGRGTSGDAPPRTECFSMWHQAFKASLTKLRITLLVGHYAQESYLGSLAKRSATETIRSWQEYLPHYVPLPHPSPRNNIWLHKNQWFTEDVLPGVQEIIQREIG